MKLSKLPLTCSLLIFTFAVAEGKGIDLNKFKTKKALCSYIEEKKDHAESMMKQSYKASEYNKLESNRKYWKNLYVDKCFD